MEAPVRCLKYSLIFAHTDKSNTSFKSVKTLRLFLCTHNNNKSLRFCEIMKANRMRFLASQSLWTWARNFVYICLTEMKKYIYRERNVYFKKKNSNEKLIFSDYVIIRMKHAYKRIHYCKDDESLSPTSLKSKTKKALVINTFLKC